MDISAKKLELIEMLLHTQKEGVLEQVGQILKNQLDLPVNIPVGGNPLQVEFYNKVENSANEPTAIKEEPNEGTGKIVLGKGHFQNNLNRKKKE